MYAMELTSWPYYLFSLWKDDINEILKEPHFEEMYLKNRSAKARLGDELSKRADDSMAHEVA